MTNTNRLKAVYQDFDDMLRINFGFPYPYLPTRCMAKFAEVIDLLESETRQRATDAVVQRWRKEVGSLPSCCHDVIREAFAPFRIALEKNETDTLGRLSKDDQVLFVLGGSWTGSAKITLGDLRKLANAIGSLS